MMKVRNSFYLMFILVLLLGLMPLAGQAQSVPTPDDDTIVVVENREPGSLDPSQVGGATGGGNFRILLHLFATLYELGQADGAIDPYLAHSFSVSDDGTEWTFHMHEGLTCHDGEPLTAEDAAYSFNRMADPANGFTGNSAGFVVASTGFVEARADSELDVTIVANKPQNRAMRLGLIAEVLVHCKDSYEAMTMDEAARNVVGSGPYSMAEWVPGRVYPGEPRRGLWTARHLLRGNRLALHPRAVDRGGGSHHRQCRYPQGLPGDAGRRHQQFGCR